MLLLLWGGWSRCRPGQRGRSKHIAVLQPNAGGDSTLLPVENTLVTTLHGLQVEPLPELCRAAQSIDEFAVGHVALNTTFIPWVNITLSGWV